MGEQVNDFIHKNRLDHWVHLIGSYAPIVFQFPVQAVTTKLGLGAFITAEIKLQGVSDFCSLDKAFGGKVLPIASIGYKLFTAAENPMPYAES